MELQPSGFTLARLSWLIRLRWLALFGIVIATSLAAYGAFPGVNWQVLAVTAALATAYNTLLYFETRRGVAESGPRAVMPQALADFLLLTIVLWASGGVHSPFLGYYTFHVVLSGILAGPRATLLAAGAALVSTAVLAMTERVEALHIGEWNPVPPWDFVTNTAAFATTVVGVAYLVVHAVGELRDRERALQTARDRAELDYQLLSTTLDELDAGLEVLDERGNAVWQNRQAQQIVPMLHDKSNLESTRFAVTIDSEERVYERLTYPLSTTREGPRVMNLYLDRTSATLAERQLLVAERLASLGRVAQGVAHELNTPLATIRTLASDMGAALRSVTPLSQNAPLVQDLSESASLIHEETARLGRITQALLAGGDLVRARIDRAVPISAVVERACAVVFAGARKRASVKIDPAMQGLLAVADPDRLVQVLVNLLQNAHDAVRVRDGGQVSVSAHRDGTRGVEIWVDDDGAGLPEEVRGHLFEPFATTKPPGEGTGLGLYTSYMLVRAMHGSLSLEDRPGGGTRATVILPAATTGEDEQ